MRWFPKDRTGTVVLAVALFIVSVYVLYPIADQFPLSLSRGLAMKRTWIGFENYTLLAHDRYFWNAIWVTFKYALMVVPTSTILGLLLAGAVNSIRKVSVRTVFTALFFFPSMVPMSATASMWKFVLGPTGTGVINAVLGLFGLGPFTWLETVATALPSLAFVAAWGGMGFAMVISLAGMQSIPDVFQEAAAIDGANAWQRFSRITVPLLMPTLTFLVIISTFGAMLMFESVFIMTGGWISINPPGGPAGSTTTMVWLVYEHAFDSFQQGYAAAIAVCWFFVVLLVGIAQFRLMSSRRVEY